LADPEPSSEAAYPITERTRARRLYERNSPERAAVHAVLDAVPLCHVGYVIEGRPYVTPTLQWRDGDRVFWHGSSASRFLRKAEGTSVCLTCSIMDGYVLARSAFNHSVNYRSAMVFGTARLLEGDTAKTEALRALTDGLFPARWDTLRPMTAQELKATSVLWMDIEEATAKISSGPPDDEEDAAFPVWAGTLPVSTGLSAAKPAPGLLAGIDLPAPLSALIASGRLR
jgi:nitroimidazol reductase NimA-like FMN-containing flavoprotein (pyridoxamine 5'-phosphate oxidase superfamily)